MLPQTASEWHGRHQRLARSPELEQSMRGCLLGEECMDCSRRRFLHLVTGLLALPAWSRLARAQAYPARPVRVIVPFAAAGPTDVFARLIAQKMSEQTGKQFYIENIAGAGGNVGSGRAAQATPD